MRVFCGGFQSFFHLEPIGELLMGAWEQFLDLASSHVVERKA